VLLVGLAVGSVAAAALMAWYGQRIGLDEYRRLLTEAPVGTRFEVPVRVRAAIVDLPRIQGAVLLQPLLAVATYTLLAGFYATASLRPERESARILPVGTLPPGAEAPDAGGGPPGEGERPADRLSSDSPGTSDPRVAPGSPAAG
jgi:hypothetical protein